MDTDARERAPDRVRDVAIVGGGPAGLSAGLWLGRMLHDVVLVDSGDPRNWETRAIHGFLGTRNACPAELRETGRQTCLEYGVELIDDHVCTARRLPATPRGDARFELELESGRTLRARRVLLAYGVRDVWPEIAGLAHGYGRVVHTCPLCDGFDVRGGRALVIGNSRKATRIVCELMTWTESIVLCTHGQPDALDDECRQWLADHGVDIVPTPVEALVECEDQSCRLELRNGDSIAFDHLFIALGQRPADDLADQLGCHRTASHGVRVDLDGATSAAGVFAAGDLTPGAQLAIRAAGDGATAALAIHKSLLPDDRRLDD